MMRYVSNPPLRVLALVGFAVLGVAVTGSCATRASECTSDRDCPGGERCLSGGGLLATGGTCVGDDLWGNGGEPDGAGRRLDGALDAGDGGSGDTRVPPETCSYRGMDAGVCRGRQREDGECAPPSGYQMPTDDETCDGRDNDCDGVTDEGCACDYQNRDRGVCEGLRSEGDGECPKPADFEPAESSCSDDADNDCDGKTDAADADCPGLAGSPCTRDRDCVSGSCATLQGNMVCAHRLFATSQIYRGDFGGIQRADEHCNNVAGQAGLEGTWKAVISSRDPTNWAKRRISVQAAVVNVNGDLIATGESDLWDGTIQNPVGYDENGIMRETEVWTGSDADGTWDGGGNEPGSAEDCNGWRSRSGTGEFGLTTSTEDWFKKGDTAETAEHLACDKRAALYCIDGQ